MFVVLFILLGYIIWYILQVYGKDKSLKLHEKTKKKTPNIKLHAVGRKSYPKYELKKDVLRVFNTMIL